MLSFPSLAPSGPPLGFVGSARSPSEIITQWQPPLEEHRNGQILGYVIRYRLYGYVESPWTSRNITNEVHNPSLLSALVTDHPAALSTDVFAHAQREPCAAHQLSR